MTTGVVEQFKTKLVDDRDIQYLNLILATGEIDFTAELEELARRESLV